MCRVVNLKHYKNHLGALPTDHERAFPKGAPGLGYLNGTNKTSKTTLDVSNKKSKLSNNIIPIPTSLGSRHSYKLSRIMRRRKLLPFSHEDSSHSLFVWQLDISHLNYIAYQAAHISLCVSIHTLL